MEDPRVVDAQSTGPLGVQLQVEALVSANVVIHVEGAGEEGMDS